MKITSEQVTRDIFFTTGEIKDYNDVTYGQNFIDQPVKNDLRTYDKILIIATGQGDDNTRRC